MKVSHKLPKNCPTEPFSSVQNQVYLKDFYNKKHIWKYIFAISAFPYYFKYEAILYDLY